ncbi:MAG: Hsp70 family protein [Rickettsiaceae bacterium]
MQILEISEPNKSDAIDEIVVGIDFGTTNSLIAISKDYQGEVLTMPLGSQLVPSVINLIDNQLVVGQGAQSLKAIKSIKRLLAKSSREIMDRPTLTSLSSCIDLSQDAPRIKCNDKYISLTEATAKIFSYLKSGAEKALQLPLKKAVISVPAYFDDAAKGQIMLAAKLANFEVLRLISEPTAAAYAYGLNRSKEGTYLVYDLGGGTFDVSVLNMQTGILQVVAIGGDNMLGGDDIDTLIAQYLHDKLGHVMDTSTINLAKRIKEELSTQESVIISNNQGLESRFSRQKFEQIITPILGKTINIAKNTLHDAEDINLDGIILVGGSTRIPLISKMLQETFEVNIYSDLDPDKIVALGAAMQAENLSTKSNSLLLDVISLSVGIELHGGIVEKIILRNTPIPFSVTKEFTTHADNQTGMQFHVVQGEREMATNCKSLAYFSLTDIPPNKAGKARIEVTFAIDADGILSITARECLTGKISSVITKPSYGLAESEIVHALEDAYTNAQKDHQERLLTETRMHANNLIDGISKALQETPEILNKKELSQIQKSINSLQNVLNLDNREKILTNIDVLNKLASVFIQKHLDIGVSLHLKGRHIDDIKK